MMKKPASAIASMLLVMTTSFGALHATAFADDGHEQDGGTSAATVQFNQDGNGSISLNGAIGNWNDNRGEHGEHGKHKGHGKDTDHPDKVAHATTAAALHAAIDKFHKDQTDARLQHKRLVIAADAVIDVMQQAIAAGDSSVVNTGQQQLRNIVTTLHQALDAQTDAEKYTKVSKDAEAHGDLQTALSRIQAADARTQAKAQAMQAAADALLHLTQQLKASLAADGHAVTTASAGSTSDISGNVTITVTNSSSSVNGSGGSH